MKFSGGRRCPVLSCITQDSHTMSLIATSCSSPSSPIKETKQIQVPVTFKATDRHSYPISSSVLACNAEDLADSFKNTIVFTRHFGFEFILKFNQLILSALAFDNFGVKCLIGFSQLSCPLLDPNLDVIESQTIRNSHNSPIILKSTLCRCAQMGSVARIIFLQFDTIIFT